jgi:hypothetical protein
MKIVGVVAEIRAKNIPNTGLERYGFKYLLTILKNQNCINE